MRLSVRLKARRETMQGSEERRLERRTWWVVELILLLAIVDMTRLIARLTSGAKMVPAWVYMGMGHMGRTMLYPGVLQPSTARESIEVAVTHMVDYLIRCMQGKAAEWWKPRKANTPTHSLSSIDIVLNPQPLRTDSTREAAPTQNTPHSSRNAFHLTGSRIPVSSSRPVSSPLNVSPRPFNPTLSKRIIVGIPLRFHSCLEG